MDYEAINGVRRLRNGDRGRQQGGRSTLGMVAVVVAFFIPIGLFGCSDSTEKTKIRQKIVDECQNLSDRVGGLSDYWLDRCVKQNMDRYEEGRPNFATHSKSEVFEFSKKQGQPDVDKRRENNPDLLAHIKEKCNQVGVLIFVGERMRRNGKNKFEVVSVFKTEASKVKNPPIGELIVQSTVIQSIDELYEPDANVGSVAVEAIKECRNRYESGMGLR